MFSISLDKLYQKIDKRILAVSLYLEDPFYYWLIKACKLKPLGIMHNKFDTSRKTFEKEWYDEWGSLIKIDKSKWQVILDSPRVKKDMVFFCDLYDTGDFGIAFSRSKVCLVSDNVILLFDGKYMSAWKRDGGEIYEVAVLSIGEEMLRDFWGMIEVRDRIKLDKYNGAWIFNVEKNKDLGFLNNSIEGNKE